MFDLHINPYKPYCYNAGLYAINQILLPLQNNDFF